MVPLDPHIVKCRDSGTHHVEHGLGLGVENLTGMAHQAVADIKLLCAQKAHAGFFGRSLYLFPLDVLVAEGRVKETPPWILSGGNN